MANGDLPGIEYYSTLRYPGTAEEIIKQHCSAITAALQRLSQDLRTGARGEFSSLGASQWEPIAQAADRTAGHVGVLQALLLGAPAVDSTDGALLQNGFANIVSDANLTANIQNSLPLPKAREGKFDVDEYGEKLEKETGVAEKLHKLAEFGKSEKFGFIFKVVVLLLQDIGLVGKISKDSAGNEIAKQVETKLEFIINQNRGLADGQKSLAAAQNQTTDRLANGQNQIETILSFVKALLDRVAGELTQVDAEVQKIERKADTLASLLGTTLVSQPWVVDPTVTGVKNRTPAKGVKDELHDIEDVLQQILKLVSPVTVDPVPPPPPPPPPPDQPGVTIDKRDPVPLPVASDPRLKKIFVYADSAFTPRSPQDQRIVRVETAAFDVTGWLDLTHLRSGDVVTTEVRVFIAEAPDLLFASASFNTPGLYSFADLARGQEYLSGNRIDIVIAQPQSHDAFHTPIKIGYQFIVESQ